MGELVQQAVSGEKCVLPDDLKTQAVVSTVAGLLHHIIH